MQRTIDLYEAQIAANNGKVDLVALKQNVARAVWGDAWSDDLIERLPPRIARALERAVDLALAKHALDRVFDGIADRDS